MPAGPPEPPPLDPPVLPVFQRARAYCRESWHGALLYFLPRNFPQSVAPNYFAYTKWTVVNSVLGSMTGVLSTQALLFAVGLSATQAIGASAALNWVRSLCLSKLCFISSRFAHFR